MKFVYLLESINYPNQKYIGLTSDIAERLKAHNNGYSFHTAKFKPWKLITYVAFTKEEKAVTFEKYLKTASGRAFANKRLR